MSRAGHGHLTIPFLQRKVIAANTTFVVPPISTHNMTRLNIWLVEDYLLTGAVSGAVITQRYGMKSPNNAVGPNTLLAADGVTNVLVAGNVDPIDLIPTTLNSASPVQTVSEWNENLPIDGEFLILSIHNSDAANDETIDLLGDYN